jgi:predicted P-loop ATPase
MMKLMEEHNAFPRFWRNLDNNRIMVGEDSATPDLTEMEIANYFQYNLGFDKVTHRSVYACIQALSKKNARSPFLDYVRAQIWDGTERLNAWLSAYWGVESSDYTREIAIKWLVSACARMDKPGTKIDWMFIVIGPQGTGKTTMPSILFKESAKTLYGEQNDKDLHMILHSGLCIGFDELDSFGKREASNLKAMITRSEDAFRPPYGASVEIFPRRFVLYGSGNRHEFLQGDPSGYRRYAIVEVARLLDFSGLDHARDQLWAEAWEIYQRGTCKFWEITGASAYAEQHVIEDPRENVIMALVDSWKRDKQQTRVIDGKIYFTLNEIMQALGMDKTTSGNSAAAREILAILRKLKVEKPENATRHPVTKVLGRWYTSDS